MTDNILAHICSADYKEISKWVKDKKGNRKGLFVAYNDVNGNVCIGYSFCNLKHDKFDVIKANNLAYDRCHWFMNASVDSVMGGVPYEHINDFVNFIERCKKYYRDKSMPVWVSVLYSFLLAKI
jgi:hypothetical protein